MQLLQFKTHAEIELRIREEQNYLLSDFERWLDYTSPKYNWDYPHLKFIRKFLNRIVNGEQLKLMIFMPPQHGKSLHTTIHFPAYCLEKKPEKRIIVGAYNYEYASNFSIKAKRLLIDRAYRHFAGKQTAAEWETNQDGFLKSFGMQSGITGTPSDLTIIDDPIKNYESAFSEKTQDKIWNEYEYSIQTRSQQKTSTILIQTKWVCGGLTDRILESEGADEWIVIKLPALAEENDPLGREIGEALCPELHSLEKLEKIKKRNPSLFEALYQQNPTPAKGNIFKGEWWQYYNFDTLPKKFDFTLISLDSAWDIKSTNDYSVFTIWGVRGDKIYLLEIWRGRVQLPELLKIADSIYKKYANKNLLGMLIEKKQSGHAIIQEFERKSCYNIFVTNPMDSKVVRAHAVTGIIAAGHIYLPDGMDERIDVPWLYDFLTELKSFPKGKHDDIVDSTTQAIEFIKQNKLLGIGSYQYLCE